MSVDDEFHREDGDVPDIRIPPSLGKLGVILAVVALSGSFICSGLMVRKAADGRAVEQRKNAQKPQDVRGQCAFLATVIAALERGAPPDWDAQFVLEQCEERVERLRIADHPHFRDQVRDLTERIRRLKQ